jgi:simple sugar transport system permease protein
MKIKLVKVHHSPRWMYLILPLIAVVLALLFCAVLLQLLGTDAPGVFRALARGSFGSFFGLRDTIQSGIPLMLCALGIAIAFKMRIWNIGAEGQFTMGAFAATWVALYWKDFIPEPLLLPVMFVMSFVFGAFWGVLCTLPNALWKVNEIITTLLMNYVAILFANYFIFGPWKDPDGNNFPITAVFDSHALMPKLFGTAQISFGLVFGLLIAAILYVVMSRTTFGYEISAIGESRRAAAYAGISIKRNIILVMLISGGICGLAGLNEVSGVMERMQLDIAGGYGYTAIIIAYLSRFNPVVVVIVSVLFGGMLSGAQSLQLLSVPSQVVTMIQGIILFFILASEFFLRYKVTLVRKGEAEA